MEFASGVDGCCPEDYFYYYNTKGSKIFHSKITGKKVAKSNIKRNFIADIKEDKYYKKFVEYEIAVEKKKTTKNKIEQLEKTLESLRLDLNDSDKILKQFDNDEKFLVYYRHKNLDAKQRKDFYQKEKAERLRNLFEKFKQYESDRQKASQTDDQFLINMGITNKKEWRKWLLKNHPDKGGNTEICAKVISLGKKLGY